MLTVINKLVIFKIFYKKKKLENAGFLKNRMKNENENRKKNIYIAQEFDW